MPQRVLIVVAGLAVVVGLLVAWPGLGRSVTADDAGQSTATAGEAGEAAEAGDAGELGDAEGSMEAASYAIGFNLGRSFRDQGVAIDTDQLLEGVRAGLGEVEPRMTEQEMATQFGLFSQQLQQRRFEQRRAEAERQLRLGDEFREANRERDEVTETASGLQIQAIDHGQGPSPSARDTVVVHYTGQFVDGETFDSSRERGEPARFGLTGVIPGWTEGLQLMREGGRYRLVVPPDLAYGEHGRGDTMPPNATLIFDIELLEVHPAEQ